MAIGVGAGMMSTIFGVGGGALSTPAIRATGISALYSIGTTLPSVLPGVVAGMHGFRGKGLIRYDIVAAVAPLGVVAAIVGSFFSHRVPGNGHLLMIATALILLANALRLGFPVRLKKDEALGASSAHSGAKISGIENGETLTADTSPSAVLVDVKGDATKTPLRLKTLIFVAVTAVAAGLISGLLGLGGGIVLVPLFVRRLGLPILQATATSLVCIGVIAVPSIIAHSYLGDIAWPVAIYLTIGTVPGAKIGTLLALRAREVWLRIAAAVVLSAIAMVYGVTEILQLVR